MKENDTICAIITAPQPAAVGVVRLSGKAALSIAGRMFDAPEKISDRVAVFGKLKDSDGAVLDTCVLTAYFAPRSYTGEDIVEISCHGSIAVLRTVIRLSCAYGARSAQGGEFTKRAFINGKLDLSQAESIMELIESSSAAEAKAAVAHLSGSTSEKIERIRQTLLNISAQIGAYVDYPDDEIDELSYTQTIEVLKSVQAQADRIIKSYDTGRIMRDGVSAAFIGRANAGKSSLMNLLSNSERSIVTAAPGTTRDVVEQMIMLGSVKLNLADTAGIRKARGMAEQMGISKSLEIAKSCSLALCVFDHSRPLSDDDVEIINSTRGHTRIAIINKSDLPSKINSELIVNEFEHIVYMSAKTGMGLSELVKTVGALYLKGLPPDGDVLFSERQLACLISSQDDISESISALQQGITADAVGVLIDAAVGHLGELTGRRVTEDTVTKIFERFCVGK